MSIQWSKLWNVPYLLAASVILTLLIMACGEDATPTATQRPAATAAPAPTQAPTAAATAAPTPTPTAAMAPTPVVSKVVVSITPPSPQSTLFHKVWVEGSGRSGECTKPSSALIDTPANTNPLGLVTDWSVSPDATKWTYQLRKGIPFPRRHRVHR